METKTSQVSWLKSRTFWLVFPVITAFSGLTGLALYSTAGEAASFQARGADACLGSQAGVQNPCSKFHARALPRDSDILNLPCPVSGFAPAAQDAEGNRAN